MPYVSIELHTMTRQPQVPVPGVYMRLFTSSGQQLITTYMSDDDGVARGLLPTELGPYTVRCFRSGYAWGPPVLLDVEEGLVNSWSLYGEKVYPDPVSSDPRVCVAFGYFVDATNQPAANIDIHFLPIFDPLLIDGNAVLKERTIVRTDKNGYVEIPLLRNAQYNATVQGAEDVVRQISVPDLANCNLPDLLFPVVTKAALLSGGVELQSISMLVGDSLTLDPLVLTSCGTVLPGTARTDVHWQLVQGNPLVVCLGMDVTCSNIVLRAIAPGMATILASRWDPSIVKIPDLPVAGQPIAISVT